MERTKSKRLLSVLLTLAMLLSLVPAMGVTASAAGTEIEAFHLPIPDMRREKMLRMRLSPAIRRV